MPVSRIRPDAGSATGGATMGILNEFKEFAVKGNAIDLAVGVVIGAAFGKIVTSLVNDVIMPPIGMLVGGVDFSYLTVPLRDKTDAAPAIVLRYGVFINTIIDFLIVAIANALIARVDPDLLLDRVDIDRLLGRIDVDALVGKVDANALVERVDLNGLVDRVDVDQLIGRVDPNTLLERVDVNALVERVDAQAVVDKVDPNPLLDRVDIDKVVDRIDIPTIVERANVSDIVGESTGRVAGSVLDAARRQLVSLDEIVGLFAYRLVRRDLSKVKVGPPELVGRNTQDAEGRGVVEGHYAGPVSRFVAFMIDVGVIFGVYTVSVSLVSFFLVSILQFDIPQGSHVAGFGVVLLGSWAFSYYLVGLVVAGSTVGKGLVGLKVVSKDGSPLNGRQAFVRVITYPISFIVFGLGLLGIAFGKEHRAWHDKFAGTCEVYEWGKRSDAALPAPLTQWLEKRAGKV